MSVPESTEPKSAKKKRQTTHYVNNAELAIALTEYRAKYKEWQEKLATDPKLPRPKCSDYIGVAVMQIANGLASKPNFANYTFIEDMVGDAIQNCLTYLHNFDAEKSSNAFAYLTTIAYHAFVRRIGIEQGHEEGKRALYQHLEAMTPYRSRTSGGNRSGGHPEGEDDHLHGLSVQDKPVPQAKEAKAPKVKKIKTPPASPLGDMFGGTFL